MENKSIALCWYRYGSKGATTNFNLDYNCEPVYNKGSSQDTVPLPIPWDEIKPFSKAWGFLIHCGMFPDHERRQLQKKYGKYLKKELLI